MSPGELAIPMPVVSFVCGYRFWNEQFKCIFKSRIKSIPIKTRTTAYLLLFANFPVIACTKSLFSVVVSSKLPVRLCGHFLSIIVLAVYPPPKVLISEVYRPRPSMLCPPPLKMS